MLDDRELTRLVNALETDLPMTGEELDTVREYFQELARLMLISGTIFASHAPRGDVHA
jgi:hypothetical protein